MKIRYRKIISSFFIATMLGVSISACSSFGKKVKGFLGDKKAQPDGASNMAAAKPNRPRSLRFSDNPDYNFRPARKYRRMTKKKFEEQAEVKDRSGSLWVTEGQGAYLFSENTLRMDGDLLNVRLIGAARSQLETKVEVIKKLLKKLEEPPKDTSFFRLPAAKKASAKDKKPGAPGEQAAVPAPPKAPKKKKESEIDKSKLSVETVPTRIVERMIDGNYRVKGSQSFMIGKREYKVIVAGIVRAEDFNDNGINSSQILDPRFDIVGQRRGMLR